MQKTKHVTTLVLPQKQSDRTTKRLICIKSKSQKEQKSYKMKDKHFLALQRPKEESRTKIP